MLLPLAGFMLLGIPLAGFIGGVGFYCFKRLRFFVALSIVIPVCTSYSGCAGFLSTAVGLEKLGVRSETAGEFGVLGFFIGACLGGSIGLCAALSVNRRLGIRFRLPRSLADWLQRALVSISDK
jgi:hypothetical protein